MCIGRRAWECLRACARAYLCARFALCLASDAGDGLRRSRGSVSAATLARNSAARFAASRAWWSSEPGICPLSMLAAGQFARDIACDRATSLSGSRCGSGASRVRLGEGERERVASRSRTCCEAPSVRGGLGEGEGERERAAACCCTDGGAPSVCGGALRSTAAPENPDRRVRRGRSLCPCPWRFCPCPRWRFRSLGACCVRA